MTHSFALEEYANGDNIKMQSQPNKRYLNLEGAPFADIERTILKESQHALVFCVGNIHGPGGRIAEFIEGIE